MIKLKSIKEETKNEIIINKSRFISIVCNVNNEEEIKNKINNYKTKYNGATHYCFAYTLPNKQKCEDDGEPKGTAGLPILNVLKKSELENTLCIVIRYFGGIKLGAGGLIRAYSNATKEAINKSDIITLTKGYKIKITFPYENVKKINAIIGNIDIKKEFNENITYTFKITEENFNKIENILTKNIKNIKKEPIQIAV